MIPGLAPPDPRFRCLQVQKLPGPAQKPSRPQQRPWQSGIFSIHPPGCPRDINSLSPANFHAALLFHWQVRSGLRTSSYRNGAQAKGRVAKAEGSRKRDGPGILGPPPQRESGTGKPRKGKGFRTRTWKRGAEAGARPEGLFGAPRVGCRRRRRASLSRTPSGGQVREGVRACP